MSTKKTAPKKTAPKSNTNDFNTDDIDLNLPQGFEEGTDTFERVDGWLQPYAGMRIEGEFMGSAACVTSQGDGVVLRFRLTKKVSGFNDEQEEIELQPGQSAGFMERKAVEGVKKLSTGTPVVIVVGEKREVKKGKSSRSFWPMKWGYDKNFPQSF